VGSDGVLVAFDPEAGAVQLLNHSSLLIRPRVDERQSDPLKMLGVARRKRRLPRTSDPGDLHVANVNNPSAASLFRGYRGGRMCSRGIERQHAAFQVQLDNPLQGVVQ
jgi:hypothetical protein